LITLGVINGGLGLHLVGERGRLVIAYAVIAGSLFLAYVSAKIYRWLQHGEQLGPQPAEANVGPQPGEATVDPQPGEETVDPQPAETNAGHQPAEVEDQSDRGRLLEVRRFGFATEDEVADIQRRRREARLAYEGERQRREAALRTRTQQKRGGVLPFEHFGVA
jgi:hypothetical protein